MNVGMKLGLTALGVGSLALGATVGGMALDKANGRTFNTASAGTGVALLGAAPGLALALRSVRTPGATSPALMGATLLGVLGGALIGRSAFGIVPRDQQQGPVPMAPGAPGQPQRDTVMV